VLVVLGDRADEHAVFRDEGRGYWVAALRVVLEKHGVLRWASRSPTSLLTETDRLAPLVIGRLPAARWTPELLARVQAHEGPVLLEAPVPLELLDLLGATAHGPLDRSLRLHVTDARTATAANGFGAAPGGEIEPTRIRPIDRDPALDWQLTPGVDVTPRQAEAWRRPGWDVEHWSVGPDTAVLAEWRSPAGGAWPAVVRRGTLTVASFGLLGAITQAHTSEPFDGAEMRSSPRTLGFEVLALALLAQLHEASNRPFVRIDPWPSDHGWALNVRHDFDRPLRRREVQWRLDAHDRLGTRATWYWRARHVGAAPGERRQHRRGPGPLAGRRAIKAAAANPRHEVAWHTERLGPPSDAERRRIERAAKVRLTGSCAHGAADCFRYQGAPNVLWAHAAGLRYTELIQRAHMHPHRFPALTADGGIDVLDIICLPHHESLDRSMRDGDVNSDRIMQMAEHFRRAGGLLQVMNHPDINQEHLFELLRDLPRDGRLDVTASEAADWWAASHVIPSDRRKLSP